MVVAPNTGPAHLAAAVGTPVVSLFAPVVPAERAIQVRETVRDNLESSQRMFAAVQRREQRGLRLQAATLAESPTLKAAVDTFSGRVADGNPETHAQLLNTIRVELAKVADCIEADAIVVVDAHGIALAAAGRMAAGWRAGEPARL